MSSPAVTAQLLLVAVATVLVVALVGWLVVRRSHSLATAIVVVALVGLVSVGMAVAASAEFMFLSGHDLAVVLTACLVAAPLALAGAVLVGRSLVRSAGLLVADARLLGAGQPVTASADRLSGALGEVRTELAAAAERLAVSRSRERALDASRRELVAWVSHDLRTPLAGLRAMSEALEDGVVADPETTQEYAHRIRVETERLTAMVDDLFELSRVHAGALSTSREKVCLDDVVSDAVASAQPLAASKGVRVVRDPADLPDDLMVSVAVHDVGRALLNLLVNAIRHTPSGRAIQVSRGSRHGQAWVAVHDSCGGIPAVELPRVFEVAFRGSAARTPLGGEPCSGAASGARPQASPVGAGLGLAIAQGIVHAHGGEITVRNASPGCRFEVALPLLPSRPDA